MQNSMSTHAGVWRKPIGPSKDQYPVLSKVLENHAWQDAQVACGVANMRGFRPQMEDGASILRPISDSSRDTHRFCGVFDGHAQSRKVASALEQLLPRRIGELKPSQWTTESGFEKACLSVDKEILKTDFSDAGSTAVFCVMHRGPGGPSSRSPATLNVTVGSVGDSQAMIISRDHAKVPVVPLADAVHRPHLMESETERVKKAGGFVANCRVDGELAVSRAFGDAKFKRDISRTLLEQKVIAVPAVAENIKLGCGETLLLACDGLFDSMSHLQVDAFVKGCIVSTLVRQKQQTVAGKHCKVWTMSECLSEVAGKLIDEAILRGSRDNLTVMLIQVLSPSRSAAVDPVIAWSDRFARRYIPPILFPESGASFTSSVRDELKSFGLDEDLTLSQCEAVFDARIGAAGFAGAWTRSQMMQVLGPALTRQWDNRDSWVYLGEFEIPRSREKLRPETRAVDRFLAAVRKALCISAGLRRASSDDSKPARGSPPIGVLSSVEVSAVEGSGGHFVLSSIEGELQSRQTSADEVIS